MSGGAHHLGGWLAAALVLAGSHSARAQDFDPHGRRHAPPLPSHQAPAGPSAGAAPPGAPTSAALIDRYTRAVLAQPGAPFPLQRLAQLVRERDGKLAAVVTDFERRAAQAGPDQ